MGFLNRLLKLHEDKLKEVIAVEPFRDYRANNKYRYKVKTKGSDGTTYSGVLLAQAPFPKIGQMINPKDWTSVDSSATYKEDWQNMYGLKSISESPEMPKIGEICINTHNGAYMVYLGVGFFLTLPNLSDNAKASIYNFDSFEETDFEGAVIIRSLSHKSYNAIVPLSEKLVTPETLELCKKYASFSGDALTILNLASKALQWQKSEVTKRIDEMAVFNQIYDTTPLEETIRNYDFNKGAICQKEQFQPVTPVTDNQYDPSLEFYTEVWAPRR